MTCDLHTHSVFSDGTLTPTELIDSAISLGIKAIALTDHNNIEGLSEFVCAAQNKDIIAVPGIEFSTDYNGTELHMLGLFIDPEHYDEITAITEELRRLKEISINELVTSLNKAGYLVDLEKLRAQSCGYINRAHIAYELVKSGYVSSVQEAFNTLLSRKYGFYKEPKNPDVFNIIKFIKSINAVAVLAHPFLNLNSSELREFLKLAKPFGLDGIETVYSLYGRATAKEASCIAKEFDMLESGGSDYHGSTKPYLSLGTGKGDLIIPFRLYEKLSERKISSKGSE